MRPIRPLHTLLIFAAVLVLCLPAVIYTTGSEYDLWGDPDRTESGIPPETETPSATDAPQTDTTPMEGTTSADDETSHLPPEPSDTSAVTLPADTAPSATPDDTTSADDRYTDFVTVDFTYFDDALFIGDSRTVGLRDYTAGNLAAATFFCSSGMNASYARRSEYDYTTGVDSSGRKTTLGRGTLESLLTELDFGKVYIMVGINELGDSTQNILRNIKLLRDTVARVEPNALIFMCANLHVTAEYSQNGSKAYINNAKINEVNAGIAELADNNTSFFIDINTLFDDEDHALDASLGSDGVHVYGKYYRKWSEWLCTRGILR